MTESIRSLLLVEDETMVATLLGEVLEQAGFNVRVAHSAIEATVFAKKLDPDIAVIDINLGFGASGVELAYILNETYPGIALLLLTKHPDLRTAGFSADDLPLGCGFLRKDLVNDSDALLAAIEEVVRSQAKIGESTETSPLAQLTTTQLGVLRLVAQGYTNAAIADARKTSVRAVEQVLNAIYSALEIDVKGEINPRVEAVRMFITAAGTPGRN